MLELSTELLWAELCKSRVWLMVSMALCSSASCSSCLVYSITKASRASLLISGLMAASTILAATALTGLDELATMMLSLIPICSSPGKLLFKVMIELRPMDSLSLGSLF